MSSYIFTEVNMYIFFHCRIMAISSVSLHLIFGGISDHTYMVLALALSRSFSSSLSTAKIEFGYQIRATTPTKTFHFEISFLATTAYALVTIYSIGPYNCSKHAYISVKHLSGHQYFTCGSANNLIEINCLCTVRAISSMNLRTRRKEENVKKKTAFTPKWCHICIWNRFDSIAFIMFVSVSAMEHSIAWS